MENKNVPNKTDIVINDKFIPTSFSFEKRFIALCVLGAIVSAASSVIFIEYKMSCRDSRMQEIAENYSSSDMKLKSISNSILSLESSVSSIKDELKSGKDNSAYVYTTISSLQRDLDIIKKDLNIKIEEPGIDDLSADEAEFLRSLEAVIKDGAPFDVVLNSYMDKLDFEKYKSFEELSKFSGETVRSASALQKDFEIAGKSCFNMEINESFWEKQKRLFKERIVDAIKIKGKSDEEGSSPLDDQSLFSRASELLSDGKLAESLAFLEKIKSEKEELQSLIKDMKKRVELDAIFLEFRHEFISANKVAHKTQ